MSVRTVILSLFVVMMVAIPVNAQLKDKGWSARGARTDRATTAATPVNTQSQDGSWSAKAARTDKVASSLLIQAAANKAANTRDDDGEDGTAIEGTWRATETFGDGSVFRILFTFGSGKNRNNGIVIHSDELFLVASPSCLNAQGVWERTGKRSFTVTDEGFCFDTNNGFAPDGKVKFKSAIKLNRRGNEFSGNMHIEGFLVDGTLVFTTDAVLSGERMPVEAP